MSTSDRWAALPMRQRLQTWSHYLNTGMYPVVTGLALVLWHQRGWPWLPAIAAVFAVAFGWQMLIAFESRIIEDRYTRRMSFAAWNAATTVALDALVLALVAKAWLFDQGVPGRWALPYLAVPVAVCALIDGYYVRFWRRWLPGGSAWEPGGAAWS